MPWVAWPGGEFSWGYNPFLIVLNVSAFDQHVDVPFSVNGSWDDPMTTEKRRGGAISTQFH